MWTCTDLLAHCAVDFLGPLGPRLLSTVMVAAAINKSIPVD
jgi:hypothetical protein